MPIRTITDQHPVFVRAREAARARPEFRVSRPPAPVTRLSNAPVRLPETPSGMSLMVGVARPASSLATDPAELPPPNPPQPDPAPPEITEIPPSQVPLPTHQPPGMTPPIA